MLRKQICSNFPFRFFFPIFLSNFSPLVLNCNSLSSQTSTYTAYLCTLLLTCAYSQFLFRRSLISNFLPFASAYFRSARSSFFLDRPFSPAEESLGQVVASGRIRAATMPIQIGHPDCNSDWRWPVAEHWPQTIRVNWHRAGPWEVFTGGKRCSRRARGGHLSAAKTGPSKCAHFSQTFARGKQWGPVLDCVRWAVCNWLLILVRAQNFGQNLGRKCRMKMLDENVG